MRRAARLLLPAAVALAAPAAASAAPASVKLAECTPALQREGRTATFEARIRGSAASDRLQVRFTLQTRGRGELGWRRVSAPGLDAWLTSDRGVGRYAYAKTIASLAAPASYRMVVRFRWLDEAGATLRSARRTSAACRQPDLRPDLVARRVDVLPGPTAAERLYVVAVRNAGRTAAPASTAELRVGERPPLPAGVPALAPRAVRSIWFTAPACAPDETLEVAVDAAGAIDEAREDDVLAVPCP